MIEQSFVTIFLFMTIANGINAQSKDEAAVANVVEKLKQAMIDGNKTELENIVLDKLSYGHIGGHTDDKTEFVEKIVSGKSDFVTFDLSEQTISVSGKTDIVGIY